MRFFLIILLFFLIGCKSTTKKSFYKTPQIKLLGKSVEVIPIDSTYQDSGVKAFDAIDGDISKWVKVEFNLDTSKYGTYTIVYSVCNKGNFCAKAKRIIKVSAFAKAGDFAINSGNVAIYEVEQNGSLKLLFQEKSFEKNSKLALFDTQAASLEDSKLYLITLNKGVVLDKNLDGLKDNLVTKYNGTLHLFIYGKSLKELKNNLKVTLISELAYEMLAKQFQYFFSYRTFKKHLDKMAQNILQSDINGDGVIDNKDIAVFNYQKDKNALKESIKYHFFSLANANIEGKKLLFNFSTHLKTIPNDFARSLSIYDDKIYLGGENEIAIIDANNFEIERKIALKNAFFRAVAINSDGSIIFGANNKKIDVIDINNKSVIDEKNTSYVIRDVDYDASLNKLFVAAEDGGLLVYNVNSDYSLSKESNISFSDKVYKITPLNDNYLALSAGKDGIIIINKNSLQKVGSFDTYGIARDFVVDKSRNMGFIADAYKGVVVVSIDGTNLSYKAHLNTSDYARALALDKQNNKLYIADTKGHCLVADIANENFFKIERVIPTSFRAYDVALKKDKVFIASGYSGLQINSTDNIKANISLASLYTNYKAYKVVINDNKAYMAQGYKGVRVFDIQNIFKPKKIDDFKIQGFAIDLFIEGDKIYLANGETIKILNKSDGSEIASFQDGNNFFYKIYSFGDKIIAINEKKVLFLNKNDLSIENLINESNVKSITFFNNKAYFNKGDKGIALYNSLTWAKEEEINATYAKDLVINGNYGYLANKDELALINLQTKKIEKRIPLEDFITVVAFNEDKTKLYLGVENKVVIVDVASFKKIGSVTFSDKIRSITLSKGDTFIISASKAGAVIVNFALF